MQTRAVRLSLLALLLITGLGAGLFTWNTLQRLDRVLAAERDVDARLDRLARNVAAFGAAQQASVVPGQAQGEALARGAALLRQIDEDVAALRSRSRSPGGPTAFNAFADTLESAVKTDGRAREHLRIGQELMAADLVFSEGRASIETLGTLLGDLRRAERAAADEDRRAVTMRAAVVVGPVVLLWVLGLFALARVARPVEDGVGEVDDRSRSVSHPREPERIDMTEAAAICTALSRVATAAEIPPLLARAADVLDASGIIVWLGAGEELFAATSHGYHPRVLARLGPLRRNAQNATAAAWRACTLRVVPGDESNNGAVIAPLFGLSTVAGPWSDGCIGVVTAEIRGCREHETATQAVTAMIAAQLATIVAAWPAPSMVEGPESERQSTTRDVAAEAADGDPKPATA